MKRIAVVVTVALLAASSSLAEERSVNLSVPGMFCASCPFVVQAAIGEVEGVLSVTTDVDERTALVLFDDAVATVYTAEDVDIRVYGDAAVVAFRLVGTSANEVQEYFNTGTFLRRSGDWPRAFAGRVLLRK